MKTYNFSVYKDRIKPLTPQKGVSGNINYYECTFEFDSDWGSLAKNAVFVRESPFIAPIVENKCIVHADVLEESGEMYIGVFGFTETTEGNQLQISTNLIPFEVDEGAYREGIEASNIPPLDVWKVYQLACNQALQGAESARNEAKEYASAAENAKKAAENTKGVVSALVDEADSAMNNAKASEEQAIASATAAERHKKDAQTAASRADASVSIADDVMNSAKASEEQANASATAAERHAKSAEGFKNTTIEHVLVCERAAKVAADSADLAHGAMENAEESVNRILQEGESFVRNYGEQYISGQKTFVEKTILTEIGSYNAKLPIHASEIEVEAYDDMKFLSPNGYPIAFEVGNKTYVMYDNGMFEADKIHTKEISSVDNAGVKIEKLNNVKKITADSESELIIDGGEILISPRGAVSISSERGSIDFTAKMGQVTAYGKPIATREYVDDAVKNVSGGGGSIDIDDVPTQGSKNAVSSGGTYTELSKLNNSLNDAKTDISTLIINKAEKSYVDSSIQQAILDSWAEVIEP